VDACLGNAAAGQAVVRFEGSGIAGTAENLQLELSDNTLDDALTHCDRIRPEMQCAVSWTAVSPVAIREVSVACSRDCSKEMTTVVKTTPSETLS